MEQGKYCCDGGCVVVKIGKRNLIHYSNGIGDGEYEAFKFDSGKEFQQYCEKNHILDPYYIGFAEFYNAEVLDYDCSGINANTLFKLKGTYFIYNNNGSDYQRSGDVYFVKR